MDRKRRLVDSPLHQDKRQHVDRTEGLASPCSKSSSQSSSGRSVDVEWASNNKYRYLSHFENWIKRATFIPVKGHMDVSLVVDLKTEEISAEYSECSACKAHLESSDMLDHLMSFNWPEIESLNLTLLDQRLHCLASTIKGIATHGYFNGLEKMIMNQLVSLTRSLLCAKHNLALSVSTPLHAEEYGGIITCIDTRMKLDSPSENSDGSDPSVQCTPDSQCRNIQDILILKELRGAPDVTVFVLDKPHIFHMISEVKKKFTLRQRIAMGCTSEDSQIGQLLYNLLAVQLKRLSLFLSPARRAENLSKPSSMLGFYIDEGKISPVVSVVTERSPGKWIANMKVAAGEKLDGKSLVLIVRLLHYFLSRSL